MALSATATSINRLVARPSCLQRASVRARCSAQPMPPPQQPGNLKARLTGAGVHIAGDVTLHIGTLNLYMSPSPDSPIAATAAAPNTSPLHPPASTQAPAPQAPAPPSPPLVTPSAPTSTYTCIAVLEPTSSSNADLSAAHISLDGSKVVSFHHSSNAIWWDLSLPSSQQAIKVSGFAEFMAMSDNGMRVVTNAVLGKSWVVQVWDAASGNNRRLILPGAAEEGSKGGEDGRPVVSCLAITGDGKYAAAGGYQYVKSNGRYHATCSWLTVWDLEDGCNTPLAVIDLPDDANDHESTALSISPDGRWVTAITEHNNVVNVNAWRWEVGSKVLGAPVALDGADVSSISSDGRTAVGPTERQVQVWDLTSGTLTATLEGHTQDVITANISADGRRAVSLGAERLVKVWDLESKTCLAMLEGRDESVQSVALSADGRHVVSATRTGVIHVWQLST